MGSRKDAFCRVVPAQLLEIIDFTLLNPIYGSLGQRAESSSSDHEIAYSLFRPKKRNALPDHEMRGGSQR
ncbi:MAG: hypothetical protein V3U42_05450, partial [candidate division NC10 bacterium]